MFTKRELAWENLHLTTCMKPYEKVSKIPEYEQAVWTVERNLCSPETFHKPSLSLPDEVSFFYLKKFKTVSKLCQ